jgi:hypothetical protein
LLQGWILKERFEGQANFASHNPSCLGKDIIMQELNDSQLESIAGGAFSLPSTPSIGNGSTSAGVSANASASGENSANAFTSAHSVSFKQPNGPSVSFAFGFGGAVAY